MMKPTVGASVHYQAFGTPGGEFKSLPRAAVVTEVYDDEEISVCVLNPSGIFFNRVKYADPPKPGCWNWPPPPEPPFDDIKENRPPPTPFPGDGVVR